MIAFEKRQAVLVMEFDRYVMEHPDFAAQIPEGAQIVIEIEGEQQFNLWARSLAEKQREPGQTVVRIKTKGLLPIRSRLALPIIENIG